MKKILVILDGVIAKELMFRIVEANTVDNSYDIIYMSDLILPEQKPANFTFYKFDPTSKSKLSVVLDKDIHTEVLISLHSKNEVLSVIENIREYKKNLQITALDIWGIDNIDDPYIDFYKGIETIANGMVERLPNIPVIAQNIGLRHGEIMEIRVPFGSSYAYRYIGSIEQKDWKIFGLYRNQVMINIKPTTVLKPNDTILVIGKPKVLMQIHNVIAKTQGQFPMPFGSNIYLYLDLYVENKESVKKVLEEAVFLNQRLKNKHLIIRVTRPTTVDVMDYIKEGIKNHTNIKLVIDYRNKGFSRLINNDYKKYDIGMMMLTLQMFKDRENIKEILELKIPVFKFGKEPLKSIKNTVVLLNDTKSYEQISPVVFDVASQIKTNTKVYDLDPIGDEEDRSYLLDHFENLAKIFDERLEIISGNQNPIRKLKKENNMLQILPLKEEMFNSRFSFKFLYTNSDFISFDMNKYNQLLVPVSQND